LSFPELKALQVSGFRDGVKFAGGSSHDRCWLLISFGDEVNEERDTDERLWHPWLRINRVLRGILHTGWSAEQWPRVKDEFKRALALKSEIRRAGWFN
jgi:hypothetical protein